MTFAIRIVLISVAVLSLGVSADAVADCLRDRSGDVVCGSGQCMRTSRGEVYCSRYKDGGAAKTRFGDVFCGKGQCTRTRRGEVICSTQVGGAVAKNIKGEVRCTGRCERGSAAMCVGTPAAAWRDD